MMNRFLISTGVIGVGVLVCVQIGLTSAMACCRGCFMGHDCHYDSQGHGHGLAAHGLAVTPAAEMRRHVGGDPRSDRLLERRRSHRSDRSLTSHKSALWRTIVAAGGPISYGIDVADQFSNTATYVDRYPHRSLRAPTIE